MQADRDTPDQSKERNKEIAVEAGHKRPDEHATASASGSIRR
jgi:hypothetical protein